MTNKTILDIERELFQELLTKTYGQWSSGTFTLNHIGQYKHDWTEGAWTGWQVGRATIPDVALQPDYSELLQKIREAVGDADGKLMHDELVARIAANSQAAIPKWQDICTAPKRVQVLLLGQYWIDGKGVITTPVAGKWSDFSQRWEITSSAYSGIRPTHWMPLPEPPQGEPL